MFWGCITSKGVGRLSICSGMMNQTKYVETLNTKLLRTIRDVFPTGNFIFQNDNVPCHHAKTVKKWIRDSGVPTLDWPAQSPDLNPIENLWSRMAKIVSVRKATTKRTLIEAVIQAWHHVVTVEELENLYNSLPRRCSLVVESKGWPTKY
jgi:uncharacterized protein (DUF2267 family)